MSDYQIKVGDTSIEVTNAVSSVGVYNLLCNIVRVTLTNISEGQAETPVTIVTNLPCSIKWTTAKERMLFKKKTQFLNGTLRCRVPAGVTIINTDKVYLDSKYYEIAGIIDVNNLGVLLEISLGKIE